MDLLLRLAIALLCLGAAGATLLAVATCSFYAKRARGLMTRFVIDGRIDDVDALRDFDREGYAYAAEASDADRLVFRRRQD